MINPSDINLYALPSVPLEDRSRLPQSPCIYFAIDSQEGGKIMSTFDVVINPTDTEIATAMQVVLKKDGCQHSFLMARFLLNLDVRFEGVPTIKKMAFIKSAIAITNEHGVAAFSFLEKTYKSIAIGDL